MNQNSEQNRSGNAANTRDPDSRAAACNAKDRSEQHLQGQSGEAAQYDRDVPVPTNRSALGDQSANL
jgi:hypothetical protein